MTYAPPTLRYLEAYWIAQRGVASGIVGNAAHVAKGTSYHLGRSQLKPGAYSAALPRDVAGLTEAASAIDLGALDGSLVNLQAFSVWLVGQCQAHAPGSADIREIIYTPDGNLPIHRWSDPDQQVYTGPGNGDNSHLWHTHVSYYRDSEASDKIGLFAPYFGGSGMAGLTLTDWASFEGFVDVRSGARYYPLDGSPGAALPAVTKQAFASAYCGSLNIRGYVVGNEGALINVTDCEAHPAEPPVQPAPDCSAAIAADRAKALPVIDEFGKIVVRWRP